MTTHEHFHPFKYVSRFSEDSILSIIFSLVVLGIALLAALSMFLLFLLQY
jgi:hypothetical protein